MCLIDTGFFLPAGFPLSYCSGLLLIWTEMEICFFALHHVPSTSVTSGISKLEDWVFVCVLDPVVILFGSKCSHSIGMHLEGVIVVIQDLSWMQEL